MKLQRMTEEEGNESGGYSKPNSTATATAVRMVATKASGHVSLSCNGGNAGNGGNGGNSGLLFVLTAVMTLTSLITPTEQLTGNHPSARINSSTRGLVASQLHPHPHPHPHLHPPFGAGDFYKHMNASLVGGFMMNGGLNVTPFRGSRNESGFEYMDEDMSDCPDGQNVIVKLITMILYALVCIIGLFGNTLVIYVVLRFSKMQTVTNIYILNLAIADECFLIGIPILIYTMQIGGWSFGDYMCKAYLVSTSITQFTSSIFLLIMSADRYIAVCHPISSPRYRTPFVSKLVSAFAWITSVLLMLPVILFASTVHMEQGGVEHISCNIEWPDAQNTQSDTTFILYSLALGFATPLTFILVFYCLVIRKLHTVGPKHKSKEKKRSHRKVTKLVLTVITVYIMCWLPHWISQVALINSSPSKCASRLEVAVFLLCGCLSYSNSAMNPILYAFLSDNFKKSFMKACTCAARKDVNAQLQLENSLFPKFGKNRQSERLIGGGGAAGMAKKKGLVASRNNNASHLRNATPTTTTTTTATSNMATTYADGLTCVHPAVHAPAELPNTLGAGNAALLVMDAEAAVETRNCKPPVLHTDL
ncbi:galanin receptor type 3 [Scaptodrosophila lebanonensis]|uniref:Galanin receptor type 3 n=1 Tax=Drosophila lebanonensis TaxID=7225 RepID=A0A6J2T9S1_DROLE|nr:galanin receptor type 3 [Scaptodrosophila lebanonensis]